MSYLSLVVDNNATRLAYIDSGAPSQAVPEPYIILFAFHGMGFSSPTFKRLHALAPSANLRFVSVNRRGYAGSTPFSSAEYAIPASGSEDEKTAFFKARGIEAATFIDKFVQQNDIPPISSDGRSGGIGLLGWSAGNGVTLSVVAHLDELPSQTQARFVSHLRAVIMYEPPSVILGLPRPKETWMPHLDESIPKHLRPAMWTPWVSAYFKHGDLSTRNWGAISYIVPSITRAPSVYNMSLDEIAEGVEETVDELLHFYYGVQQEHAIYRKACFDRTLRALVPRMKVTHLCGDETCSPTIAAFFNVQEDAEVEGGGLVNFHLISGANHFMHWDRPEETLQACLIALELRQPSS
ncbi:hypothetical protein BV25DRAFT_1801051 [Artomyces pyxidatus]|uniref:Uncharacterized protein n=1 Tax=Artomyces pyxidatus TaxID=48021 RepID=A0ACB8T6K3_9AGAM|nr:hypothetical protein BV25DRAFT_1801051 [Artomyces pyxidatus]